MKLIGILSAGILATGLAEAQSQEVGRVVSSTPVMQQVSVPRQVCTQEQVEIQRPNSGAGAAIGAIAGGALGSASGHGRDRAAATVIGAIGGAILGDRIEGTPESQLQTVQRCSVQNFMENRVSAYQVVYEFAGRQYSVQMPQDPGPTIALQIAPVANSAPVQPSHQAQPVYPTVSGGTVITSSTVTYPYVGYPSVISAPRYIPQVVLPGSFYPSYHGRPFVSGHGRHYDRGHSRSHRRDDDRH